MWIGKKGNNEETPVFAQMGTDVDFQEKKNVFEIFTENKSEYNCGHSEARSSCSPLQKSLSPHGWLKANEEGGGLSGCFSLGTGRWPLWAALVLQWLPSVTSGRNQDRGVKIFGTQGGNANKRTQGRNREAEICGKKKEIEKKDIKETRNRWKSKLGKHLLRLRPT